MCVLFLPSSTLLLLFVCYLKNHVVVAFPVLLLFLFLAEYPIVSIEDPFDKEDWEHTKYFSGLQLCQVHLVFPLSILTP